MNEKPKRTRGTICPLLNKDVSLVCHRCEWYVHLQGAHPQTGETMNHWGCSVPWLVLLSVELKQMEAQTGAAVESFRNEMIKLNKPDTSWLERLNGSN